MKRLPFPETPMFLSYHNRAFPFGVIQANCPEDITRWMCSKCVSFIHYPNSPHTKFNISVWDMWGVADHLMHQQVLEIKKEYFKLFNIDLLHVLKTALDNDHYINGSFNEKYIPEKWAYGREDHDHDFLLIGYDNDTFFSVGYVADGRFKLFEIPAQNLLDGLMSISSEKVNLYLLQYADGAVPVPKTQDLIHILQVYLSTGDPGNQPAPGANSYGVLTNIRLRDHFVNEVRRQGRAYVDVRYSRIFYEHKWVLSRLVDVFLCGEEKENIQVRADKNLERAKTVHMLGLKMNCTGKADLIDRIASLIDEIVEEEQGYIPLLIQEFKKGNLIR